MKNYTLKSPLLILVFTLVVIDATAINYYIATTGSDSNNGTTLTTPKKTLANVFSSFDLNSGDLIHVAAGIYSDKSLVPGADDSGFSIIGAGMDSTYFDSDQSSFFLKLNLSNTYVSISNLTIKDYYTSTTYEGAAITLSTGAHYFSCSKVTFQNCDGNGWGGAFFVRDAINTNFSNCFFMNCDAPSGGSALVLNGNCKINLNTTVFAFNSTNGTGSALYLSSNYSTSTITNCLFYKNTAADATIYITGNSNWNIQNCTLADNTAASGAIRGIRMNASPSKFCNVYNSISTGTTGSFDFKRSAGLLRLYNCSYKAAASASVSSTQSPVFGSPQFVDAANNDYRIRYQSNCRDAGFNTYSTTFDIAGNTRDAQVDIGCYEYVWETLPTDFFRSDTSGNWTSLSSWQFSPDSITWAASTLIPGINAAGTSVCSGHTINVNSPTQARSLRVVNGGVLTLSSNLSIQNWLKLDSNSILSVNANNLSVFGASTVAGTLQISTGTADFDGAFNATGGAVSFTSTGQLKLGGAVNSLGNLTEATSTIIYDYSGAQNIVPETYYHLQIDGSGTKTLIGNTIVKGNMTISAGILSATGATTFTIKRNWYNNGTGFIHAGHTVIFSGTASQFISGSMPTTFYSLVIANGLGNPVILAKDINVQGNLSLINGKLSLDGHVLTMGTNAVNGSINGGSSSCYIKAFENGAQTGKLIHHVNSFGTYRFPIGDQSYYSPVFLTLSKGSLNAASISVYTKNETITGMNPLTTDYVNRYWEITPIGITDPLYDLQLYYHNNDIQGNEASLLPVKRSGMQWYIPVGSTFPQGTAQGIGLCQPTSNLLTWDGLSTFSQFGGISPGGVSLPIQLIHFSVKKEKSSNLLQWTTISEQNNDFFTIEKTTDGTLFESLGTVKGNGNSLQKVNYFMHDYSRANIINYYRLKQTDFDGNFTYSEIIAMDNRNKAPTVKTIIKLTNILGQPVDQYFKGLTIIWYSDGTFTRTIQ